MKKIVSLLIVLLTITSLSYGQKVYTNKKLYDNALKQYCDELDSYENYIKKVNFYNNFSYDKTKGYPSSTEKWISYFEPLLNKSGVKFDNYINRLHENVNPSGTIYINFLESTKSNKLLVSFDDSPRSNAIYTASTFKFNHPGKPPVFKKPEEQKKDTVKVKKVINQIKLDTQYYADNKKTIVSDTNVIIKTTVDTTVTNITKEVNNKVDIVSREVIGKNYTMTEVDVICNGDKKTYKRISYNWGGIFYYVENHKPITENQFYCVVQSIKKQ